MNRDGWRPSFPQPEGYAVLFCGLLVALYVILDVLYVTRFYVNLWANLLIDWWLSGE